jgi:hypothetical protein
MTNIQGTIESSENHATGICSGGRMGGVTPEIVAPDSVRGIYEEALAELTTSERDQAKRVIAERIREVQRLKICLAKAEADLQRLLQKEISEIALL